MLGQQILQEDNRTSSDCVIPLDRQLVFLANCRKNCTLVTLKVSFAVKSFYEAISRCKITPRNTALGPCEQIKYLFARYTSKTVEFTTVSCQRKKINLATYGGWSLECGGGWFPSNWR